MAKSNATASVVENRGRWIVVPQRLQGINLADPLQASNPDLTAFHSREDAQNYADRIATTRAAEYLGWLPIYKLFGNCGHHPQFRHLDVPPPGWHFDRSAPLYRLKPDKFAAVSLDALLDQVLAAAPENLARITFENSLAEAKSVVEANWRGTGYDIIHTPGRYTAILQNDAAFASADWPRRFEAPSLTKVIDFVADISGFKGHFQRPFEVVLVFDGLFGSHYNVVWSNGLFFLAARQDGTFHSENYCETDQKVDVGNKLHLLRFAFKVLGAVTEIFVRALLNGGKPRAITRFLRSRSVSSQILALNKRDLVFLPSVPYYLGRSPWVIELEDFISLCYPFIHNGKTATAQLSDMPEYPAIKAMLQMRSFKGVITHIRSTAENLPKVFNDPGLASKCFHVPMGVALPLGQSQLQDKKDVNLLFTSSWHQSDVGFFVRGGLDVLHAFQRLARKYDNVNLVWRSPIPAGEMEDLLNQIAEETGRVRIYRSFVAKEEFERIFCDSDIFVLPSARIHVVSILEAMGYGMATVVSDGWGIQDYVTNGHNGVVIPGRWGVASWDDPRTGMFHENYAPMYQPDEGIISALVENLSLLVEDPAERKRLGANARRDVAEKFNFENWNASFQCVLDTAAGFKS